MEHLVENMLLFSKNFNVIQQFLERLSENDPNVEFLSDLIDQMNCTRLQTRLAGISANFTALTEAITSIQGPIELVQPLEIISNIEAVTITEPYRKKLKQVLKNNPDLNVLKQLGGAFLGEKQEINVSHLIAPLYKFAPPASAEIERVFSSMRDVLSPKRQSLTAYHELVIFCWNNKEI